MTDDDLAALRTLERMKWEKGSFERGFIHSIMQQVTGGVRRGRKKFFTAQPRMELTTSQRDWLWEIVYRQKVSIPYLYDIAAQRHPAFELRWRVRMARKAKQKADRQHASPTLPELETAGD